MALDAAENILTLKTAQTRKLVLLAAEVAQDNLLLAVVAVETAPVTTVWGHIPALEALSPLAALEAPGALAMAAQAFLGLMAQLFKAVALAAALVAAQETAQVAAAQVTLAVVADHLAAAEMALAAAVARGMFLALPV